MGACVTEGTGHRQTCNPLISSRLPHLTPASPGGEVATPAGPASEQGVPRKQSTPSREHRLLPLCIAGRTGPSCHPASACLGGQSSRERTPCFCSLPYPQLLLHLEARKGSLRKRNQVSTPCCPYPLMAPYCPQEKVQLLSWPEGSFGSNSCHFSNLSLWAPFWSSTSALPQGLCM